MLTDAKIKNAEIRDKPYKLGDSGGLHLLVKPNGRKYWRLKYRHAGKEKLLALGVYGISGSGVSLKNARKKRDKAKEQLSNGVDPSLAKQQLKAQFNDNQENSFAVIANEWHIKKSKSLAATTANRQRDLLDNDILPYLGRRPIKQLETFELVGCLNRIVDRGALTTAHKARQSINQICRYAKQTGRIKFNPANDMEGSIPPLSKSHMPAITKPAEFGRLLVAIDEYKGTHIVRTALGLAPLLFQRPGELCGMEWEELDLDAAIWTIPQKKKKERNQIEGDHAVPLCTQAIALLKDIQYLTGNGSRVFPNQRDHSRPIGTEALNKALRTMGFDTKKQHCTHGFRASARTMLDEQLHIRLEWIEQQLAHTVKDPLGRAYNRTKHLPERIEMMQRWADYLDKLKRQSLAGNVITADFKKVE
jgi:integrase